MHHKHLPENQSDDGFKRFLICLLYASDIQQTVHGSDVWDWDYGLLNVLDYYRHLANIYNGRPFPICFFCTCIAKLIKQCSESQTLLSWGIPKLWSSVFREHSSESSVGLVCKFG